MFFIGTTKNLQLRWCVDCRSFARRGGLRMTCAGSISFCILLPAYCILLSAYFIGVSENG